MNEKYYSALELDPLFRAEGRVLSFVAAVLYCSISAQHLHAGGQKSEIQLYPGDSDRLVGDFEGKLSPANSCAFRYGEPGI